MGSLPNLQALNDDPNVPYTYSLQEKDDLQKRRIGFRPPVAAFNSQHCVERYKVDRQYIEHRLSQFLKEAKSGMYSQAAPRNERHRKVRHTHSAGSNIPYVVPALWDDYLMEMTSPISTRSSRSNATWNPSVIRRRGSFTSSHGANSVHRLISVVRAAPPRFGPVYSRRVLCRNLATLCLGHITFTAALLPILSLQSSMSIWYWGGGDGPGALLLASTYTVAAVFSLLGPYLIHIFSCHWTLILGYIGGSLFFACHLYPNLRWLIPGYLMLGIFLGPLSCAQSTFAVTLANKLTYVLTDEEELQDAILGNVKEALLWKLSRGLQISQDLGMALGNFVSWLFLQYALSSNLFDNRPLEFFEEERGDLICGYQSCPIPSSFGDQSVNSTWNEQSVIPCRTTGLLASVFVGCGLVSIALTAAFTNKIRLFLYQDPLERPAGLALVNAIKCSFRDPHMQLAAPLSIFIGLQQGFIYSGYSKWYVVCSQGISDINLVFVSMSFLQAIASFTLSLLMQNVPRILVIGTGFVFHACLLLVLTLWKPAGDDSAILYVIAAAWGVCNAIWEAVSSSILLLVHTDENCSASFAQSFFFKCLGLVLSFLMHDFLCMDAKIYALVAALLLGVCPLIWLEWRINARNRKGTISRI